jgi:HAD superfamily hydrolase (TIGR01509 family)
MYKAIIFDFFGVFCTSIATNWFKKAVSNDTDTLAAFQALCTQSDYGRLSRADFNKKAAGLAGTSVAEAVAGIEAETAINAELVAYVKGLKPAYKIACLSNGTREWTLQVITDQGLGNLFDEVVLSGDLGIIKPSREIYAYTLDKLRVSGREAIFVDDRKVNTDAAEALDIRSLVFSDTQTFITELNGIIAKGARVRGKAGL